jgi:hypothetical protein
MVAPRGGVIKGDEPLCCCQCLLQGLGVYIPAVTHAIQ